ncbi:MAG TPA: ShlB/FhaC/HecB family hemolysin secretion/activation protein [Rhizomicrobium sp.]
MIRFFSATIGAALAICAGATTALAQSSPFIIDRSRIDRTEAPPKPEQAPVPQPKPENQVAQITPFVLKGVQIQGTSVDPKILSDAASPYVGRMTDAKAITEIAQRISDAYASAGDVALYTVTVPNQDFHDSTLHLIVTEGYIEHVEVHGDTGGDVSLVVSMAQKLTSEHPLKRSTLERYLSLIRDLPGLTVDAQLLRGDQPGAVQLSLGLKQKRYNVALSLNDSGNSLLGRWQFQSDVSLYNLFREGEQTTVSLGTSTLFNRYQYYAISHSEALNEEGLRASASYGYLHTRVPSSSLTGDAQTLQFGASYPLIRSYTENLLLAGSIDGIDSSNALLGLAIANENIRAARLSASYSLADPRWALALSGSMNIGLDILGARVSNPATETPEFRKLVLQGTYNHLIGDDWVVRLRAASQLAFDKLPVSELYALGGPDFGRAFLQATALGDSALAESVEVGFDPKDMPAWLSGMEVFGFADYGDTWYRARSPQPSIHETLASAGAGVRFPIGAKTSLELQAANALTADVPGLKSGGWRFLFAVTGKY